MLLNVQLKCTLLILHPSFGWTYPRSWMDYPSTFRESHGVLLARVLPPHIWALWHYSKQNKPFLVFPMFSALVQHLTLSIASLLSYYTHAVLCRPAHLQCGITFFTGQDEWLLHKLEAFYGQHPLWHCFPLLSEHTSDNTAKMCNSVFRSYMRSFFEL